MLSRELLIRRLANGQQVFSRLSKSKTNRTEMHARGDGKRSRCSVWAKFSCHENTFAASRFGNKMMSRSKFIYQSERSIDRSALAAAAGDDGNVHLVRCAFRMHIFRNSNEPELLRHIRVNAKYMETNEIKPSAFAERLTSVLVLALAFNGPQNEYFAYSRN